jgi:GNAT superfamily N-acetyltransferase
MKLAQAGVVTGARKSLLPGKIVTSFLMGSSELYRWAHENPALEMRGSDFTNSPATIARNDRMISINSALAVDLTGQVAADTLMGRFFSGIGGQVDFVRGASMSRGGKAIIALPSTAKDGRVSRIQAAFDEGAGVVTSRGDVRWVVTEYGAASLWGKTIRERAMALIEIAHPDHRAELLAAAKHRRFVFADQVTPRAAYPWSAVSREKLPGGEDLIVRPGKHSDEEAVQRMFYELSDQSSYQRFFVIKRHHTHDETQKMVDVDYDKTMSFVAHEPDRDEILALARYDLDPATCLADVAFCVRDDWQGRGIGSLLMRKLGAHARAKGIMGLQADVLVANQAMLMVFHQSGWKLKTRQDGDVVHIEAIL